MSERAMGSGNISYPSDPRGLRAQWVFQAARSDGHWVRVVGSFLPSAGPGLHDATRRGERGHGDGLGAERGKMK